MQGTARGTGAGHLQRAQRVARDRLLWQLERQRAHCIRELARRTDTERRLLAAIAGSRSTAATLAGPVAAAAAVAARAADERPAVPRARAERSSLVPGEIEGAGDTKSSAVYAPGVSCESALRSDQGGSHRHDRNHYHQHRLTSQSQPLSKLSLPSPHEETYSLSGLNGHMVNNNNDDEHTQTSSCLEDKHISTGSKNSDTKHKHRRDDDHYNHQNGNRHHNRRHHGHHRLGRHRTIARADLAESARELPAHESGALRADGQAALAWAFDQHHHNHDGERTPSAPSNTLGPRTGARWRRDEAARARKAEQARRRRERIAERTRLLLLRDGRGRRGERTGEAATELGDWAMVLRDVRYLRIRDHGQGSRAGPAPERESRDGSPVE